MSMKRKNRGKSFQFQNQGVALSMYNVDESIRGFADCFNYGLKLKMAIPINKDIF